VTLFIGHFETTRDYTLQFTLTYTLVSTVTTSLPLLGSGFQRLLAATIHKDRIPIVLKLTQSESYTTTDGQSSSLSWTKAPIWDLRPHFYYCHTVAGLLIWVLSLTRERVYRLQLLLDLASVVILGSESR
jgi:hypothetical protein